jgi:para-nitrobenzyl esterase
MAMKLRCAAAAAVVALACCTLAARETRAPQATVESGVLRGAASTALPQGGAFLGIPYAAQPVGALRWGAPQPAPRWSGVRTATQMGPACPQWPSPWLPEMLGVKAMATDEACLYLNVWTPELHPHQALPVFVWVHGGGNVEGSGQWPPLGETLAQQGIVVVSINYRLGVFGFFASAALDGESPQHVSGNYGHLDQIAALAWVRRNIAAFGGDPTQVTIGGESSGALDVCNLMASPRSAGLFRGAIMESGVCVDSVYPTLHEAEQNNQRLANDLGITARAGTLAQLRALPVSALRALPADKVLDAAERDDDLDLEPNIDGWVLPDQPAVIFKNGKQAAVRVLVGSNENEVSIFASPIVGGKSNRPKTVNDYRQWMQRQFGSYAQQAEAAYPVRADGEALGVFNTMFSDYDFAFGAWLLAKEHALTGQPAFLYRFSYVGAGEFAPLGAFHSEELMFLSRHYWTSWVARPEDAEVSRAIVGYWTQFVKTGDPNGSGLPPWPAFAAGARTCQEIGLRIGPEAEPREEKFDVFQEYLADRLRKAAN